MIVTGKVLMVANAKQSYDLTIECRIEGTNTSSTNPSTSTSNAWDKKVVNFFQHYGYYKRR